MEEDTDKDVEIEKRGRNPCGLPNEAGIGMPSNILNCNYNSSSLELDPSEFSFETDHEALRNNADYLRLMKTFAILQAQKIQAVKDIDRLLEAREEALKDPIGFVDKLQRGENMNLPGKQKIAEIPDIDWNQYQVSEMEKARKPETRRRARGSSSSSMSEYDPKIKVEGMGFKVEKTSKGQILIRGRVFDEQKPKSFNQPWTLEEQRKLEELLIKYPSEDVEMERWKKIAAALGNRTAIQVQSRTQKYFLKLQRAGLPIPGRQLKVRHKFSGKSMSRSTQGFQKRKTNPFLEQKKSTFFPEFAVPVKMNEDDMDESSNSSNIMSNTNQTSGILNDLYELEEQDVSDEEGVAEEMKSTKEYQELMWLKRIRREKELQKQLGSPWIHKGFRCDGCNVEPIIGGRFQCSVCKEPDTVDFCCDCAPKGLAVNKHKPNHTLKPVRRKQREKYIDQEYTSQARNYLDPNYD